MNLTLLNVAIRIFDKITTNLVLRDNSNGVVAFAIILESVQNKRKNFSSYFGHLDLGSWTFCICNV